MGRTTWRLLVAVGVTGALVATGSATAIGATPVAVRSKAHQAAPAGPEVGAPEQTTLVPLGLGSPDALALGGDGALYITEPYQDRVVKVSAGGVVSTVGFSGLSAPGDVAVDGDGTVYVTDSGNNRVLKLPVGGPQSTVSLTGVVKVGSIAVDSDGTLFVADQGNVGGGAMDLPKIVKKPVVGSQTTINSDLTIVGDMNVDQDHNLFVADSLTNHILKIVPGGAATTVPVTGLNAPTAVVPDGAGNLYVTDWIVNKVLKVPVGGGAPAVVGFTGLNYPQGLAADSLGTVFVADNGNRRVLKLPAAGTQSTVSVPGPAYVGGPAARTNGNVYFIDQAANAVKELPGGAGPAVAHSTAGGAAQSLAVDSTGTVYAAVVTPQGDGLVSTLVKVAKGGAPVTIPSTGLNEATGVAVDGAGNVYVANAGDGTVPVVKLPKAGGQTSVAFTGLSDPGDVAVDSAGTVYVTDPFQNRVLKRTAGGTQTTLPFSGLKWPTGIAVDGAGTVFVSDRDNDRVVSLTTSGTQSTLPFTGLNAPGHLAVDTLGAVHVNNQGAAGALVKLVLPATAPSAPTIGTITGGAGKATVRWTAPGASGGSPITGYTVTPFVGGAAQAPIAYASTATTQVISGLANGTRYRFAVAAVNGIGTGPSSATSKAVVPPFATLAALVGRQYQDIIGRAPTASESTSRVAAIELGTSAATLVADLRRSSDATVHVDPATRLYFAYFLRIPDRSGWSYWVGRKRTGTSLLTMSSTFAGSAEFKSRYGTLTNKGFVNLVYQNVLGRPGDAAGVAYWTGALDSGAKTRGSMMVGFSESPEYKTKKAPSVDVAVTWIDMLGASPDTTSFGTWVTKLTTGGKTVTDLASALLADPRYATRIAGL